MNIPDDLRFTQTHEWARKNDDGSITVGISEHAQEQLGDLVFVETPEMDAEFDVEEGAAVVESVKAASDIYAPFKGKIVGCNSALTESPELINSDPYGEGWIFKIMPENPDDIGGLMTGTDYKAMIESK